MTTRIDMLNEWWENAEQGSPKPGDTIIINLGGGYAVEVASEYWAGGEWYDDTRILARAPKPKPAWHDAVAVIAHTDSEVRHVWVREGSTWWAEGMGMDAYELRDVTPLIEAKVTDEMIERGQNIGVKGRKPDAVLVRRIVTAALGLETE